MDEQNQQLKGSVTHFSDEKHDIHSNQVVIKPGPLAYKTAEISAFADPKTGQAKSQTLTLKTFRRKSSSSGWDFKNPEASWRCEGEGEIAKLKALLDGTVSDTGVYRKIDPNSAAKAFIDLVESGKLQEDNAHDIANALSQSPQAIEALAATGAGLIFTRAVQQVARHATLSVLNNVVKDPASTEPDIQKIVENDWWLFGGRYIAKSERRALTVLDQLDIPLICYDGSLHIVELKRANVPEIVVRYRNHYIVGSHVNEAVGQVENYLRELEEQRDTIKNKLDIECRRISATIVVGHVDHAIAKEHLYETLRTYNSHLSRVEVITYDELIANTTNALRFGSNIQ